MWGLERRVGTAAASTGGREPAAEASGRRSDAGQLGLTDGARKKALRPAVRREVAQVIRQEFDLSERRVFGLHLELRREGKIGNHKRVYRL